VGGALPLRSKGCGYRVRLSLLASVTRCRVFPFGQSRLSLGWSGCLLVLLPPSQRLWGSIPNGFSCSFLWGLPSRVGLGGGGLVTCATFSLGGFGPLGLLSQVASQKGVPGASSGCGGVLLRREWSVSLGASLSLGVLPSSYYSYGAAGRGVHPLNLSI
jgi:hypothetical protein